MMSLSDAYFDQVLFVPQTICNCALLCYNGSKRAYEEGLVSNSWYIFCFTMLVTSDAYKMSSRLSYSIFACKYFERTTIKLAATHQKVSPLTTRTTPILLTTTWSNLMTLEELSSSEFISRNLALCTRDLHFFRPLFLKLK